MRELRMREPMRRVRLLRHESARKLVLALRAAFEEADAALDAKFERLIVAGFEVQPGDVVRRSPIAAIEGVRVMDVERCADRLAFEVAEHEQQIVRHRLRETLEQLATEI